jgi:PAS domain S-box-containing protein
MPTPPPPDGRPLESASHVTDASRLEALRRYDILDTEPEEAFDRLTRLAAHLFDVPVAIVNFVTGDRQWFKSAVGTNERETGLDVSFCVHAVGDDDVMVVEDLAEDERFVDNPYVTEEGFRFYAGAPLVTPDGHRLGTLCVLDTEPRALSGADTAQLADLAKMVMDELELRRTSARLTALFEDSPDMINVHDDRGNILDPNPRLCERLGHSAEELTDMKVWDIDQTLSPDQAGALWEEMDIGDQRRVDGRYRRRDGSTFPVEVHIRHLHLDGVPRFMAISRDITELKAREAALRTERNLLERVFQTSPTATVVLDADGYLRRISDRAQQILGIDPEAARGRAFNDPAWTIRTPDGEPFPEDKLPFVQVRATGAPVSGVECTVERPDGTRRHLSISGAPLHEQDGTFVGTVFHLDDLTARQEQERELRRRERLFRKVFENAALGIALVDEEGRFHDTNPAFEQLLEYESRELSGEPITALTYADDIGAQELLFDELVAGDRDRYQIETRYVRRTGEVFWGCLTVSSLTAPHRVQAVALLEDIDTERKRKRDLHLFQKMVEQSEDAILLTESEPLGASAPEIVYVNPAFTETTGFTAEEAIGQTPEILWGPETQPHVLRQMRDRLRDGAAAEGETINYRKDGTPFVDQWKVAPVRDETDDITHLVSILRDVTDRRRMQERLLEVQEEERRRIDQEIHDEMGGLLTSLQLTVEMTRMQQDNDEALSDHLNELEQLVETLASKTRSISRKLYPSSLPKYGLAQVLPDLIGDIESHHGLEVTLESALGADDRFSSLVERTACWIVNEALVNVARHAETDRARVVVASTEQGLRLQVIDDGRGFDLAEKAGGEKLGIEGIRHRVERLNGEFKLETAPGEGTRLSARLPLMISSVPR